MLKIEHRLWKVTTSCCTTILGGAKQNPTNNGRLTTSLNRCGFRNHPHEKQWRPNLSNPENLQRNLHRLSTTYKNQLNIYRETHWKNLQNHHQSRWNCSSCARWSLKRSVRAANLRGFQLWKVTAMAKLMLSWVVFLYPAENHRKTIGKP